MTRSSFAMNLKVPQTPWKTTTTQRKQIWSQVAKSKAGKVQLYLQLIVEGVQRWNQECWVGQMVLFSKLMSIAILFTGWMPSCLVNVDRIHQHKGIHWEHKRAQAHLCGKVEGFWFRRDSLNRQKLHAWSPLSFSSIAKQDAATIEGYHTRQWLHCLEHCEEWREMPQSISSLLWLPRTNNSCTKEGIMSKLQIQWVQNKMWQVEMTQWCITNGLHCWWWVHLQFLLLEWASAKELNVEGNVPNALLAVEHVQAVPWRWSLLHNG